ncbi:MAG: pyridoxal-phosphate dependent enzyme, partial [Armatimonadetes bacterium]|nr:pyridoxal-phosphate dependent enzyme [Armatimonadota bacterium]
WQNARTMASGMRVPAAVGDFLMLRALRESGGTAVTVSDSEIDAATRRMGKQEGLYVCPEGGAVVAALEKLVASHWIRPEERVVLFNTGCGLKYPECFPVDLPVLDPEAPVDYAAL